MKIDTSTIQGFDGMTAEQKLAAVLGMDMPEPDMTGWVKKDVFDAKASEASNLSKQLKARMTEEEAKKAEEATARQELEDKYNELLKKSNISEYTTKCLKIGFDEKLAADTARAFADDDKDKVFANIEKFKTELEKKIRADILKETPRPGADNGGKAMTVEDISKIRDAAERQAAIAKNLELYGYKER